MKEWLKRAVFYEIYPQSFCDTNADGIGDIRGIISKLDYVQSLGCNALWLNPCFASPFVDAGYDISDYYMVAPRYGTNADLKELFEVCHRRGMHVMLDLVPGHTSSESKWFKESCKATRNEYTDRYVWTNAIWEGLEGVGSISGSIRAGYSRSGVCATNYYTAQPALNYGFYKIDEGREWEQPMTAPGPMATREAIKNVMRFWLGMGADGFRVDMAGSLVKNDPDQAGTIALWQDFRAFLDKEFPEAVMVSEWGYPDRSLKAGFHMDFLMQCGSTHYLELFRGIDEHGTKDAEATPYFSRKGQGDCKAFFDAYKHNTEVTAAGGGLMCLPSGNHDIIRLARTLDMDEMKIAFAFILTMPGAPFIYYGDEIGMKYVEDTESVEGGYYRTGSRSPMAWDTTTNAGFSAAASEKIYIKQDDSKKERNAATETKDPNSLLNAVRKITAVRAAHKALSNDAGFELLQCEDHAYPVVYKRVAPDKSETVYVVINPCDKAAKVTADIPLGAKVIYAGGNAKDLDRADGGGSAGSPTLTIDGASVVMLAQ